MMLAYPYRALRLLPLLAALLLSGCPDSGDFNSEAGVPDGSPFKYDQGKKPDAYQNPCAGQNPPTITGKVYAPNGKDPVAGASVGVPVVVTQLASGVRCESCAVQGNFKAHVYSRADGSFTLTNLPLGKIQISIQKGQFRRVLSLTSACGATLSLPAAKTTLPGKNGHHGAQDTIPNIAVITGAWDKMEKVLDKLGVQQKTVYNGKDWGTGSQSMQALLQNGGLMRSYHLILINCGTKFENLITSSLTVRNNIRAYVKAGGRLFVTDYSYDYIEQVFPDFIDFEGAESIPMAKPETPNAAELGTKIGAVEAEVKDSQLKAWLGLPAIKALLPSGKVSIVGLDTGWAVQKEVNLKLSTKVWVEGPVNWIGGGGKRPLTASYYFHDNDNKGCGRVVFSSYHTWGDLTDLLPQERILEYLMLEIGDCRVLE